MADLFIGTGMRKIIFLMAVLLPFTASAKLMDLTTFKLDNGMDVAVVENHKAPVVLQMLYYKTGSVNDPKGKGGIAHLLEHLMFRGTKKVPDQMFNRITDVYGAENNAYTTYDETGYYEFSDISKLELMMALEADRMVNLTISDEAFFKERDVVLEERFQRFETQPTPLFYETLNKLLWQDSPQANPVSGSVAEIKALERTDAEAFYKRWYKPNNALLVLAGDITVNEAKTLAAKYYGGLKADKTEPQKTEEIKVKAQDVFIKTKLGDVKQPRFAAYIRLEPDMFNKKEILALDIFAEYLAGDDTAYLYDKLVYEDKKLLSADVGVSYDEKLGGSFSFYATPADNNMPAEEISALYEKEVAKGLTLLTEEKLTQIKNQVLSDTVYLQENPESAARFAGSMLLSGYTTEEIINYDEAIKAVMLEDIKNVFEKLKQAPVKVKGYLEGLAQ